MNLRIFVCTWNVAQSDPITEQECEKLLQIDENEDVDIYAVGFQEIKTGARETVNSFIDYDEWAKRLSSFLSKRDYYLIENVRVQGISLCLFASLKHLPYIRFVQTEIERTGVASAWGDKGGVAVSCSLYGQQVCFLNVHLSAHLPNEKDRIEDIKEIFREMEFKRKSTILGHDLILMFGDMNFRIDDLTREFIIETVAKKNYSSLWEKDQLNKHKKVDNILSQFEEPTTLNFAPSYKFDPGTDTYDTSEKQRKPAWTDRIMWRINPEVKNVKSGPGFLFNFLDGSFKSLPVFKQSDHKPVICKFEMKIVGDLFHEPLLRIDHVGSWTTDQDGELTVEHNESMEWDSKDYIGLYKGKFKDFRSYEAHVHVSKIDDSSSSSSDSDGGDAVTKFAQKIASKEKRRIKRLKFKKSQIKESGTYRLGYNSANVASLVAVSLPFEVFD